MRERKSTQLVLDLLTIRLAGMTLCSTVDGVGVRLVIFVQGCPHHCRGCHNSHTWDPAGGYDASLNDIFGHIDRLPNWYSGITISGGEPFAQEYLCSLIAKRAHDNGHSVWTYTGYTIEELEPVQSHPLIMESDVLVVGPYLENQKTADYAYYGSNNQQIIYVHDLVKKERIGTHENIDDGTEQD